MGALSRPGPVTHPEKVSSSHQLPSESDTQALYIMPASLVNCPIPTYGPTV